VALGHLHGPQQVKLAGSSTTLRYAGTPIAYSFSEKDHTKSVAVVELDATGDVDAELLPVPVPRPLSQVRGTLDELLARAEADLAPLADHWVKAILTDTRRPDSPMERLRAVWPHTLVLEFAPEGALVDTETDLARLRVADDPLDVAAHFVEYVSGEVPNEAERALLARTVEAAHAVESAR
jgi:exonuclease SbcD